MTAPTHPHAAMSLPPDTPQTPAPEEATATAAAGLAKPRTTNGLVVVLTAVVTVLGGAFAALLIHEFNSIDDRFAAIDVRFVAVDAKFANLEANMDAKFERLEANMDAKFANMDAKFERLEANTDAKFDSLEAGQAEIARTLAVLVAELNARAAVDAALAGQLLAPGDEVDGALAGQIAPP